MSVRDALASVRDAARSEPMRGLARWGLSARAAVYLLIGVLALGIAFGTHPGETDQRGALETLTGHSGGTVLVWVIAFGMAAYALWQLSQAAFGVVGEGKKAFPRVKSLVGGLIYASFAVGAFEIVLHRHPASQAGQEESVTGDVMKHAGGRWLVGIVGAVIVVSGLVLIWEGVTRKFAKYLDRLSGTKRRVVEVLGVVGTVARGIVFAASGGFVVAAAVEFDPKQARGLDRALRELADTAAGPGLLVAVAIGLMIFGIYGFAEAIWRRT